MTLDAGGTNFVFSAIQGGKEIADPVVLPACADCLDKCLGNLVEGFKAIQAGLPETPVAISFAFPGPADYQAGIIGDLPNFPSFRGGVALGPFLEDIFGIPVFINNDGSLFAYGEALTGVLPEINRRLREAGSTKRYKNLLGVTLGTGFGAGVVIDGELLRGDNAAGGYVWCLRNKKYPEYIVEESVSIRAVMRVYAERSGDAGARTPKEIFEIAEGIRPGNREAGIAPLLGFGGVEATVETVVFASRANMSTMLSSMPVALIAPPKTIAHSISQMVLIIPDIPRVATRLFNSGTPVSRLVLPYSNIVAPFRREANPSSFMPEICSKRSGCAIIAAAQAATVAKNKMTIEGIFFAIIIPVKSGISSSHGSRLKVFASFAENTVELSTAPWSK